MEPGQEQEKSLDDDALTTLAVDFVLCVLKSADVETIGPKRWWERARSALETSAGVAEAWPQMVSKALGKMQVLAPTQHTSNKVSSIGKQLAPSDNFERFRYLCQRDALYIVAMARAQKEAMKPND